MYTSAARVTEYAPVFGEGDAEEDRYNWSLLEIDCSGPNLSVCWENR